MKKIMLVLLVAALWACNSQKPVDESFIIEKKVDTFRISNQTSQYELVILDDDMIKVAYHPNKKNPVYEETYAVLGGLDKSPEYEVVKTEDSLLVKTARLQVVVKKTPFVVDFYKPDGSPLLICQQPVKVDSTAKTIRFEMQPADRFYGMGQKSISVDRKGYAFNTTNIHIGGYTKPYATQQVNIPYVYSPVGYGVLFDNSWPGLFDMGKTDSTAWSYIAENGSFTYYVMAGEDLQELQNQYYKLTGYPPLPPKWTMGLLQSKCGYEDEAMVDSIVDLFEKKDLPLDALILDAYWFGGYKEGYPHYMGNFTWLKRNFADHKAYLKKMKNKGIKTILINEPYINLDSKNYDLLAEKGYLVSQKGQEGPYLISPYWAGDASMLDITNPGAQDWLWQQFQRLIGEGVDGLWIDLTEPEYTIENGQFHIGPEEKVHNIYNLIFARTIYDGWRKSFPDKRVFNLTRAGFAGIQRFGAVNWSGDASKTWIALKLQVPMLIGCAMSGMPHYSSDIGGFTNAHDRTDGLTIFTNFDGKGVLTTPELYIRWFQFGVFSPMLRPHSGEEQYCEPFAHGSKAETITADYLRLRYRLIPYLYSYAHKTTTTAEQLIKPMFMAYDDAACHGLDYQYMFGNEMLVAPVLDEGQTTQTVYLPKLNAGMKWIRFDTDEQFEGEQEITTHAKLDEVPVFVPQPAIIPLGKLKRYVEETPDDTLTWRVYPGGNADFTLYEDDGLTYAYESDHYAQTTISTSMANSNLTIELAKAKGSYKGMLSERHWIFDIRLIKGFSEIMINGKKMPEEAYHYNKAKGQLIIEKTFSCQQDLTITIKGILLK